MLSLMKTISALLVSFVALYSTGCATDEQVDPAVAACRADAQDTCNRIGYGKSDVCFAAFAQGCSEEDAARAEKICQELNPSEPACVLEWR